MEIYWNLFVITVILSNFVRYISEVLLVKRAKPNQIAYFVRYNRVFVVTVIVITEFDCISSVLQVKYLKKYFVTS